MRKVVIMKVGLLITAILIFSALVVAKTTIFVNHNHPDARDSNAYTAFGNVLYAQGLQDGAVALYHRGVTLDPNNAQALNNLGVYYAKKNSPRAEGYFLRSIASEPKENTKLSLATFYHDNKRYDEAISILRELVSLNPESATYNYDLAINIADKFRATAKGNLQEAIDLFKKAESLEPGFMYAKQNAEALTRISEEVFA